MLEFNEKLIKYSELEKGLVPYYNTMLLEMCRSYNVNLIEEPEKVKFDEEGTLIGLSYGRKCIHKEDREINARSILILPQIYGLTIEELEDEKVKVGIELEYYFTALGICDNLLDSKNIYQFYMFPMGDKNGSTRETISITIDSDNDLEKKLYSVEFIKEHLSLEKLKVLNERKESFEETLHKGKYALFYHKDLKPLGEIFPNISFTPEVRDGDFLNLRNKLNAENAFFLDEEIEALDQSLMKFNFIYKAIDSFRGIETGKDKKCKDHNFHSEISKNLKSGYSTITPRLMKHNNGYMFDYDGGVKLLVLASIEYKEFNNSKKYRRYLANLDFYSYCIVPVNDNFHSVGTLSENQKIDNRYLKMLFYLALKNKYFNYTIENIGYNLGDWLYEHNNAYRNMISFRVFHQNLSTWFRCNEDLVKKMTWDEEGSDFYTSIITVELEEGIILPFRVSAKSFTFNYKPEIVNLVHGDNATIGGIVTVESKINFIVDSLDARFAMPTIRKKVEHSSVYELPTPIYSNSSSNDFNIVDDIMNFMNGTTKRILYREKLNDGTVESFKVVDIPIYKAYLIPECYLNDILEEIKPELSKNRMPRFKRVLSVTSGLRKVKKITK